MYVWATAMKNKAIESQIMPLIIGCTQLSTLRDRTFRATTPH
jgi:hypothetical protein